MERGRQETDPECVYWMCLPIKRTEATRSQSMEQLAKRLKNGRSCVRRSYQLRMKKLERWLTFFSDIVVVLSAGLCWTDRLFRCSAGKLRLQAEVDAVK